MKKKLWVKYKNGNCMTTINLKNGTKIHETIDENATEFKFDFSESCDFNITNKCDGGCPWCYQNCTPQSNHADIMNLKFLDTLHPYTELAINGNDLTHPDLILFLEKMKERNILVSMTVNQMHFERNEEMIRDLLNKDLIKGLGVSLKEPNNLFIEKIKTIPNAVIHIIAGVITEEELDKLSNNNLKVLILGYKTLNRGKSFLNMGNHKEEVKKSIEWLKNSLKGYLNKFKVISFDNLAIKQLDIKNILSDEQWNEFYQGDDGSHTFYIDGVSKKFARTSISSKKYDLLDNIDDMFRVIRNEVENDEK